MFKQFTNDNSSDNLWEVFAKHSFTQCKLIHQRGSVVLLRLIKINKNNRNVPTIQRREGCFVVEFAFKKNKNTAREMNLFYIVLRPAGSNLPH
jgi:hypothetical protein